MRALITTLFAQPETSSRNYVRSVISSLKALGIDYGRCTYESLSASKINNYDLLIAPLYNGAAALEVFIDDATVTKPFFLLGNVSGSAGFGATPGISGGLIYGGVDQFVEADFTTSRYLAMVGNWATLTDGYPILTAAATSPLDESAQAQAGKVCAWSSDMAGGSKFYVSSLGSLDPLLPILIQHAVNDGEMVAPPRMAPVFLDIDHPNGTATPATEQTIDNFMQFVPNSGVIWGGVTNATAAVFDNMPIATSKALKKWTNTGKLKLCVHFHETLPVSGTWPAISDVMTKEQQETEYLGDKAIIEGHDLALNDPVHGNLGNNAWNEATLQLYSGDISKASDGANTVSQAGYNCRTMRVRSTSTRFDGNQVQQWENHHHMRRMFRGIHLLYTFDMGDDALTPHDTVVKWRDHFRNILLAMSAGTVLYYHDDDFEQARQDPGVDRHGVESYSMMSEMNRWMTNTAKFWADPVDYVISKNFV